MIEHLNSKQKEVVTSPSRGNTLVLAGAGSGKTRVLVHRIIWLLQNNYISSNSILTLTFSNKAVSEIRNRVNNILDLCREKLIIDTFHGLAYRFLRTHYSDVNLPHNFQILDNEDQKYFVRRAMRNIHINERKNGVVRRSMNYINKNKERGIRPKDILKKDSIDSSDTDYFNIYLAYQKICDRSGLVDFSELILRAYELFSNNLDILRIYQKRFTHVLVDEFQDTSKLQYEWIKMIFQKSVGMTIVGDDDQSIYGWRGANPENMNYFLKDFPNSMVVRLEQNYRSTKNILQSANALISCNKKRFVKTLWTDTNPGEPICIYYGNDESDESRYIVKNIIDWKKSGGKFNQCAILYRRKRQSYFLEEALIKYSIPYHIHGDISFFKRKEVKETMSYLRLMFNRKDDESFEIAVNTPARGIGKKTMKIIRDNSKKYEIDMWQSCKRLLNTNRIRKNLRFSIKRFLDLIDLMDQESKDMPICEKVYYTFQKSGLSKMYGKKKDEISRMKVQNISTLVHFIKQFYEDIMMKDDSKDIFRPFPPYFVLSSEHNMKNSRNQYDHDAVNLMTIHASKGLEFPVVFISGMEEGIFPSKNEIDTDMAEERRLAYVGLTRAMKKLVLTCVSTRSDRGRKMYYSEPSRFISEIPRKYVKYAYFDNLD
ncbi:UvrD-helicase domain-containing protein [Candidatus Riesia pediculischaeffi]|uniref:DNA 3'-5' helicase n=2 Tax=Candidatus Riesia pediculischaeffi TaxID=428411 RepID=A0A1V0HKJ1_9ENTR|nr:UvrD-helicase domain-containing protein [Candidatus Riesia pediculischaeffi]ARC53350.1 hypothetical protein AOQ87_01550 [Candidatus Riesia pediculischaeffi]KIE63831.1 ATP-dependent DNA helicase UvrD/PcrA [Candidatus Riesia pediculischaeffi PTSU]